MTLEELKAAHAAMTGGLWWRDGIDEVICGQGEDSPTFLAFGAADHLNNTAGIVALHNYFPAVIGIVEELRNALEGLRYEMKQRGYEGGTTCWKAMWDGALKEADAALTKAAKPLEGGVS